MVTSLVIWGVHVYEGRCMLLPHICVKVHIWVAGQPHRSVCLKIILKIWENVKKNIERGRSTRACRCNRSRARLPSLYTHPALSRPPSAGRGCGRFLGSLPRFLLDWILVDPFHSLPWLPLVSQRGHIFIAYDRHAHQNGEIARAGFHPLAKALDETKRLSTKAMLNVEMGGLYQRL